MRFLIGFILAFFIAILSQNVNGITVFSGFSILPSENLSSRCDVTKKEILVLLDTAEVHLLCDGQLQGDPLIAVVVKRGLLQSNYPQLPRTTYITRVNLYPSWTRTASMIRNSCRKGKCKSGRTYPHGHSSNPFDLGKVFLEGMGAIRIHDVAQSQKKRLKIFDQKKNRFASSGCVNLKTSSLRKLLTFIGFDKNNPSDKTYKSIPIIFKRG